MPHNEPNYGSVGPEVQEASKATYIFGVIMLSFFGY